MELRAFWKIFRRRWLLVLIPPLVVALFSAVTYQPPPAPGFNVGVNFIVAQSPSPGAELGDEDRYYSRPGSRDQQSISFNPYVYQHGANEAA
jgi:hypothetical protein